MLEMYIGSMETSGSLKWAAKKPSPILLFFLSALADVFFRKLRIGFSRGVLSTLSPFPTLDSYFSILLFFPFPPKKNEKERKRYIIRAVRGFYRVFNKGRSMVLALLKVGLVEFENIHLMDRTRTTIGELCLQLSPCLQLSLKPATTSHRASLDGHCVWFMCD